MAFASEALSRSAGALQRWNRRLHYYLGLYFLFFTWLFAFTGLLLNHGGWKFAEFWPSRRQSTLERKVQPPDGNAMERAQNLARQLGLRGEIEWTATPQPPGRFQFRVNRPGHVTDVKMDLATGSATVQRTDVNWWGVVRALHTFTGVHAADPVNRRDWIWTTIWAYSMDALAAGLIVTVLSGIYMWIQLRKKLLPGLVALSLGVLTCGLFALGLAWLYK